MNEDPDPFELEPDGTLQPTRCRIRLDGPDVLVETFASGVGFQRFGSIETEEFESLISQEPSDADGSEAASSNPVDIAYEFLLLGCDVELAVGAKRASLDVRFPESSIPESERHWDPFGVPSGSLGQVYWIREEVAGDWLELPDRAGFRSIDEFVATELGELFSLALLLAPDWIKPDFLSPRQGWHSEAKKPPQSVLPSEAWEVEGRADAFATKDMRDAVDEWALRNGFAGPFETVAKVVEHLKSLNAPSTGHYTVSLSDGHCYIGETVQMADRLTTHTRRFGDRLVGFYVRPDLRAHSMAAKKDRKMQLLLAERSLIHDAQRAGLFAENFREMSFPQRPFTGFADAVSPSHLRDWISDPEAVCIRDEFALTALKSSEHAAKLAKYHEFSKRPYSGDVVEALRRYLLRCVPYPARTELTSWSLSCLPGAKRGGRDKKWTVVSCLSISMTEMLTILIDDGAFFAFFAVNDAELNVDDTLDLIRLVRRHPSIKISIANYSELGPGVSHIETDSLPALLRLLDDVEITRAAASVALRVCRVGPSRQRAVHNPYLVEKAIGQSRVWS